MVGRPYLNRPSRCSRLGVAPRAAFSLLTICQCLNVQVGRVVCTRSRLGVPCRRCRALPSRKSGGPLVGVAPWILLTMSWRSGPRCSGGRLRVRSSPRPPACEQCSDQSSRNHRAGRARSRKPSQRLRIKSQGRAVPQARRIEPRKRADPRRAPRTGTSPGKTRRRHRSKAPDAAQERADPGAYPAEIG